MIQNNRILLKISGEALLGDNSFGLDIKTVNYKKNYVLYCEKFFLYFKKKI